MPSPAQTCQFCATPFDISVDDLRFYQKMEVPPPTFCPTCRFQRRSTWRNERALFHRRCARSGADLISIFHPNSEITVFDRDLWWKDDWDACSFGVSYDPAVPFLTQFAALMKQVPFPAVFSGRCQNTSYCNHVGEMKDSYLTFAAWGCDGVLYSDRLGFCRDCVDCLAINNCELCYECVSSSKLYNCRYVLDSHNCSDCDYLYDCVGCQHCILCTNLRHQSYCIRNVQYSREDYVARKDALSLSSFSSRERLLAEFSRLCEQAVHRFANLIDVENSTGHNLWHAKNCQWCFDLSGGSEDCKYTSHGGFGLTDTYDSYGVGANTELLYECVDTGERGTNYVSDIVVWTGTNVSYSVNCHNCVECFGCLNLRGKSYCILNKQYTAAEYKALKAKVVRSMTENPFIDTKRRVYRYGEFFPSELSPFAYNDTLAQEFYPLTAKSAKESGLLWREADEKTPRITVRSGELPDSSLQIDDMFLRAVIECASASSNNLSCTRAFRLTQKELEFCKANLLPLPRRCPNCRHQRRLALTRPYHLWRRRCDCANRSHSHKERCENSFLTPFSPAGPEHVLCEECYQKSII